MTKKPDYHAMTIEQLQEAHARLCAVAFDAVVYIPEHLTFDFDTMEAGAEICTELDQLLWVASAPETVVSEAIVEPPKKPRAKKTAPTRESTMTDTTTTETAKKPKITTKKKTAKKVTKKTAKKTAKKVTKKTAKKATGDNKTSKIITLMKRTKGVTRAEVLELTGWKAVSMQQLAENAGVKLVVDESERPFHYKIKAA
jgi:hypothetical protein